MKVLTERVLLFLEDLLDEGALLEVLRAGLDVSQDERQLGDVLHRGHEQVRQLQLFAPPVLAAPL
jgi:hypothetical protein